MSEPYIGDERPKTPVRTGRKPRSGNRNEQCNRNTIKSKTAARPKRRSVTNAQIAAALISVSGIVLYAARKLRVTRNVIYQRMQKFPELKAIANEAIESTLDLGEAELIKAMKKGNLTAIIFYLKCKGKHRGYIERQEIDQTITDLTPADPPDIIFEFIEVQPVNGNSSTIRAESNLLPATTESSSS